uniref:Uncharacterized protein n=1 Tax=Anguilla anguilla TaxID=7936 RepID=A0A0E9WTR9_ANGAN
MNALMIIMINICNMLNFPFSMFLTSDSLLLFQTQFLTALLNQLSHFNRQLLSTCLV